MATLTKQQILSGGGEDAEKFRDHVGEVWTIHSFREVPTANGPSVLFEASSAVGGPDVPTTFWAPGVVAGQLRGLRDNDYLPGMYRFASATSAQGRQYFTLADLAEETGPQGEDEVPDEARAEPEDLDDGPVG